MTAQNEYNFGGSDKEGSCTHTKNQNISFLYRLSAPTYSHSSLHSQVKRSDIKEDNDQASEIDGEDEQASRILAKSKLFTVNENKRETAL